MTTTLLSMVLLWLLVALGGWLVYELLRQHGRILLRLEALEEQVAQLAAASAAHAPRGLDPGSIAPGFELPDLSGKLVSLAQWRGRRVLLIFFNPRCGFCEHMAAGLAALGADGGAGRPIPLLITTGDPEENRRFMEQHGIRCPVLVQQNDAVSAQYQTAGTPMGYLLDEEGMIATPLTVGAEALLALAALEAPPGAARAARRNPEGEAQPRPAHQPPQARRAQGGDARAAVPPAAPGRRRAVPGGLPGAAVAPGLFRPRVRPVHGTGPRAGAVPPRPRRRPGADDQPPGPGGQPAEGRRAGTDLPGGAAAVLGGLAALRHGGILVGLADGSVRNVGAGIRPATWWAACTPAGGEILGDDW